MFAATEQVTASAAVQEVVYGDRLSYAEEKELHVLRARKTRSLTSIRHLYDLARVGDVFTIKVHDKELTRLNSLERHALYRSQTAGSSHMTPAEQQRQRELAHPNADYRDVRCGVLWVGPKTGGSNSYRRIAVMHFGEQSYEFLVAFWDGWDMHRYTDWEFATEEREFSAAAEWLRIVGRDRAELQRLRTEATA